ncbi:nSTAND1 domain-containing NTPase [Thauera phenylacetica]
MNPGAAAAASADERFDAVFAIHLPARPYPGLRPFEQHEWPIFFGRERMTDEIVDRLLGHRLLVVHGDSGCGKSSLVRAGVLPRLEQESARGGVRWRTCTTLPRAAPLWNLARALAALDATREGDGEGDDEELEARTIAFRRALNFGREAPTALAELLGCGPRNQVCILVDQFEELFEHARRHGPEEAALLAACLVGLLDAPPAGLYAVLTMRSEFLGACSRYEGFAEAVNRAQYLLPRMEHDDLMRAIREPAVLYDGEVTRELAERLIVDGGGGQDQLPLIQHGLMLLHDERAQAPGQAVVGPTPGAPAWRLGVEHYRAEHGLAGLLSAHADAVQARAERQCFGGEATRVVEDLFRALTDINAEGQAIRRPCALERLVAVTGATESALRCVVDAFRADGVSFLKPYGHEPLRADELIDISHEALIRCWRRVAEAREGWLAREFRNGLVWRALLVQADSFERDPGNVLGATTTDERERWLRRRNPAWAERYGGGWERVQRLIAASVEARALRTAEREVAEKQRQEARRLRRRSRALAVGLSVLAFTSALGGLAWQQSRIAEEARRVAEGERELALTARDEVVRQLEALVEAREAEAAARAAAEAVAQEARQSATALASVVDELERATTAANAPASGDGQAVQRSLTEAKSELRAQVSNLSNIAVQQAAPPLSAAPAAPSGTPAPRMWIYIAEESQRKAAEALETRLRSVRIGDDALELPGIVLVKAAPTRSMLRCFRTEECRQDGDALVRALAGLLQSPKPSLEDFSTLYGSSGSIRARHYELWFAPGAIVLPAHKGP